MVVADLTAVVVSFFCCRVERKRGRLRRVKHWKTALTILAAFFASLALADDFKTVDGKEYKNVTVSRVEADGIVIKTKTGLSKIYFVELPKDVQERFHYGSRRQLERQSRNASTVKVLPIGLRALSKKSSTSGNRSYKGNTSPARQS